MSMREKIIKRLKEIDDLPTIPLVMSKLNKALNDSNCSAVDIEKILMADPAIAARILRTVNSPLYAAKGQITDLKTAIARLGFNEVRNITMCNSVFQMFDHLPSNFFDRNGFWEHCLCTSLGAIELGKDLRASYTFQSDELHLTGLVHDIGKIVLDAYFREDFEQALVLAVKMKMPLFQAERVVMEIDHAEIGAIVAMDWNLPDVAVQAIRYHHQPELADPNYQNLLAVVQVANSIANINELGCSGDIGCPSFSRTAWELLDLPPEQLPELIDRITVNAEAIKKLL